MGLRLVALLLEIFRRIWNVANMERSTELADDEFGQSPTATGSPSGEFSSKSILSAIWRLTMARRFLVSVRFDRYPRPDAFDRLSRCSLFASFLFKEHAAIVCLPTACGAMRAFPTGLVS